MRKSKALFAALLLASGTVFAQESDKPFVTAVEGAHLYLEDGEGVLVGRGVYMNEQAAIIIGKDLARLKGENDSLKADKGSSVPMFRVVVFVAAGVLLGGTAGFLIAANK